MGFTDSTPVSVVVNPPDSPSSMTPSMKERSTIKSASSTEMDSTREPPSQESNKRNQGKSKESPRYRQSKGCQRRKEEVSILPVICLVWQQISWSSGSHT